MPPEVDVWFDSLMAEGELAAGLPPALVAVRNPLAWVNPVIFVEAPTRPPRWTDAEETFLRNHLGILSLGEIGARLGRSEDAIKIRYTRRRYPAPSRRPGWLTGRRVGEILHLDIHAVCSLFERGLMPLTRLPGERGILAMRRITLYRWAINPDHWPYFIRSVQDTSRISDPHLRRLIERQKERWGDEWWTPGQVAAYHGVDHTDVNRLIRHGKIAAMDYGNWWIRRSEATRPDLVFHKGKGAGMAEYAESHWSPAADAFIRQGKRAGLIWAEIARQMKRPVSSVSHRGRNLLREVNQ